VYKSQDIDLGSHILIQTFECGLYAVFQFPPSALLPAGKELWVFSRSGADNGPSDQQHPPDNHYFFSSQPRWASGPNCVTILTRPDDKVRLAARVHRKCPR